MMVKIYLLQYLTQKRNIYHGTFPWHLQQQCVPEIFISKKGEQLTNEHLFGDTGYTNMEEQHQSTQWHTPLTN